MDKAIEKVDADFRRGMTTLEQGDRDGGIVRFQQALDGVEEIADPKTRRDWCARLAMVLVQLNAPDRGLQAAQEAVVLDQQLGDRNLEGQDKLLCGTAIGRLGNLKGAEAAYRDALQMFIEDESWANAASANTNLAILLGQEDIGKAIDMFEESLEYLKRQAFPDTEITTRIALIQALVVAQSSPERVFKVATGLFEKFLGDLRPDQRQNSVGPLEEAIECHLKQRPVPDVAAWKAKRFPMIYG